ncbi:hypothetical protein N0V90_001929 [Kalmusia sp. IMI 367209]|nr:hypothetical protein N0V90_001929 [Kalmusia sp. IMI 367209]
MAQTLSFSPLALDLPNSRMSVDFSTFTSSHPKPTNNFSRKPQPPFQVQHQIARRPVAKPLPLPNLQEEPEAINVRNPSQKARKWPWTRQQHPGTTGTESPTTVLSRANSNASTISSTSLASTGVSSVFSRTQTLSTARTSLSSVEYSEPQKFSTRKKLDLSSLPLSLLEHILAYALCLPLTVSVGPQNSENRHMQYRYHRAGLDYIDIQLIRKHPCFMVSHYIRDVALDVFHQKCDFVVDMHRIYHTKVSSTVNDNLRIHEKFWINEAPPRMVSDTLRSLSRLNIRLPVPSCENGGHRGRDEHDWMDGSDGRGGGNWKIKSMRREQDDATRVQKCLEAIIGLVMVDPSAEDVSRGRTGTLSRSSSLKRSLSRARSRSRGRRSESRSSSRQGGDETDEKRRLKRLEVFLVKRNSHAMVLPETLGLIKLLRSVPVNGFTKYFFELEEQQVLWATKHRKKWKGFEPDGTRLLNDLQGLTIADKPIEPIRTPTEFKFINVSKTGKLQLSDTAIPKTPIVLERPRTAEEDSPHLPAATPAARRMGLPWVRKKIHQRKSSKDSFAIMIDEGMETVGSSGTITSGRNNPPSVDELRKIAEDIKNGLY